MFLLGGIPGGPETQKSGFEDFSAFWAAQQGSIAPIMMVRSCQVLNESQLCAVPSSWLQNWLCCTQIGEKGGFGWFFYYISLYKISEK